MSRSLPLRAAVFASGSGSNFQALADVEDRGASWSVQLVISDREAGVLERADRLGVSSSVIQVRDRPRDTVEAETLEALAEHEIDVIFLAGYLRLVPSGVVGTYSGRILNIHPALLPAFGGKGMYGRHVHEAVIRSGARLSGPTVHLVDERYDEGHIVAQWPVPVLDGDTPDALAARILEVEHMLYPLAADHLCHELARGVERVGPMVLPGAAFTLSGDLAASALARRHRATFPSLHHASDEVGPPG